MRLNVRLPRVEPEREDAPEECPDAGCGGRHFRAHGIRGEPKALRDPQISELVAYRYRCLKCGRIFRSYPGGVTRGQQSDRLKAISVLLCVLGLSHGAVEDLLTALGVPLAKVTVYENVQGADLAARECPGSSQSVGGPRLVIGSDGTYLKVKGAQIGVQVVVDDRDSDLLGWQIIVSENTEEVEGKVREAASRVGAQVLVSDDLDSDKRVADTLGLEHPVCRSHVKRNVDELAEELREQLQQGELTPEGLLQNPEQLQYLVRARPRDGPEQLERMYEGYKQVPLPKQGERLSV